VINKRQSELTRTKCDGQSIKELRYLDWLFQKRQASRIKTPLPYLLFARARHENRRAMISGGSRFAQKIETRCVTEVEVEE